MMIILAQTSRGRILQFSASDADLSEYLWTINNSGYACYNVKGNKIHFLHRIVAERIYGRKLSKQEFIDHIDGNPLNNQRVNLRIATAGQNTYNRDRQRNNKSGFKGVSKKRDKWRAQINANRVNIRLGESFNTPEEAAQAYNEAAIKYHGEHARLNVIK